MKKIIKNLVTRYFPVQWKEFRELSFWKSVKKMETTLSNRHYKFFYTTHFGLDDNFYCQKKLLDIGCGPRGSLEWASMAARRIGLDPLSEKYKHLGTEKHKMEYVSSFAEDIPFDDSYFDVVCSFNSLDHVSDISSTITEIKRVTCKGGIFLLLVEINHPPTACEPHQLTSNIINDFHPEFTCNDVRAYVSVEAGLYQSIENNRMYNDPENVTEIAWLSAMFERQ